MSVPTRLRRRWFPSALMLCAVLALGLMAYMLVMLHAASGRIGDLDSSSRERDAQVNGLANGLSSARAQIQSLGATPVVAAPSEILKTVAVTGAAGATGAQGPGPSDAQVAAAVAAYLLQHPVPGPSVQEIAAAVTAYLIATPPPSGPAGAQGPGPSDQQIADAVASYMAANPAPSGPAGPPGTAGKNGTDGQNGSPPAGFSFTDPSGNSYSCSPDDQTPAPHYTCTSAPSPSVSPSDTSTGPAANAGAAASIRPTSTGSASAEAASEPIAHANSPTRTPAPSPSPRRAPVLAWLIGVPFYRRGL